MLLPPAPVGALSTRRGEEFSMRFAPSAQPAAIYGNAHLKDGARPVSAQDFIPSATPREPIEDPGMATYRELLKVANGEK